MVELDCVNSEPKVARLGLVKPLVSPLGTVIISWINFIMGMVEDRTGLEWVKVWRRRIALEKMAVVSCYGIVVMRFVVDDVNCPWLLVPVNKLFDN